MVGLIGLLVICTGIVVIFGGLFEPSKNKDSADYHVELYKQISEIKRRKKGSHDT